MVFDGSEVVFLLPRPWSTISNRIPGWLQIFLLALSAIPGSNLTFQFLGVESLASDIGEGSKSDPETAGLVVHQVQRRVSVHAQFCESMPFPARI